MKKFLVCTDFTEHSQNAVRFGADMAAHSGAEIILLHAFFLNVVPDANVIPQNYAGEISVAQKTNSEEKLAELVGNLSKNHFYSDEKPLKIKPLIVNGIAGIEIIKAAKSRQTDLIIVGTKDENAFSRFFFGSTSDELLDSDLPCPLLVIPEKCRFEPDSEIVFAGTKDPRDIPALIHLNSLSFSFVKNSIYLYINNLEQDSSAFPQELKSVENIGFIEVSDTDVENGIRNYFHEIGADILVMHKHEKHFFESLIHKSHTEEKLRHADFPLWIYKDYYETIN